MTTTTTEGWAAVLRLLDEMESGARATPSYIDTAKLRAYAMRAIADPSGLADTIHWPD